MAAPESTKFQVNFKLNDGTLINIYADNNLELESGLTIIQDAAELIKTTSVSLGGGTPNVAYAAQALGATPVAQSSSVIQEGHCKHGKLTYRESKPGADKQWKGWFCPSPKDTPDQCAPKFLR